MSAFTDTASVTSTTTSARNALMKFRPIIDIPPYLIKIILNASTKDPAQLILEFAAATATFNTIHVVDTAYPDALINTRRIFYFLWGAANKLISPTISIPQQDGVVKQFLNNLVDKHIQDASPASPSPSAVAGPSDATLGTLTGNIHSLTTRLESYYKDKKSDRGDKKEKFKKLPSYSQQIFLFASSKSAADKRKDYNPELEVFLQQ